MQSIAPCDKAIKHYCESKPNSPGSPSEWSPFRATEKKYMVKYPPPDLSAALDFRTEIEGGWKGGGEGVEVREIQVRSGDGKKAFIIPRIPGLVILLSFLSEAEQRSLIISSLRDTTRHPNETNLDAHYNIPDTGLWTSWENRWHESRRGIQLEEEELIQPKASISSGNATTSPDPTPTRRTLVENIPASPSTLPVLQFLPKPPPTPSPYIKASPPSRLLFKLRWANIGRSYHWGTKSYDFDKKLAPFPEDVREYCKRAVKSIEWEDVWGTETEVDEKEWGEEGVNWRHWSDEYEPDAGIVNFYQLKDTLMGHVDRSEVSSTSPLVSISIGNAAVFLIGGLTRSVEPVPIILRSGDVVIMSGPRCRRAYHGVPRILEGSLPNHLKLGEGDAAEWGPFAEYMESTRINANVRQTFPKGFVPPGS